MNDVVIEIRARTDFYLLFALKAKKFKFHGLRKLRERKFLKGIKKERFFKPNFAVYLV